VRSSCRSRPSLSRSLWRSPLYRSRLDPTAPLAELAFVGFHRAAPIELDPPKCPHEILAICASSPRLGGRPAESKRQFAPALERRRRRRRLVARKAISGGRRDIITIPSSICILIAAGARGHCGRWPAPPDCMLAGAILTVVERTAGLGRPSRAGQVASRWKPLTGGRASSLDCHQPPAAPPGSFAWTRLIMKPWRELPPCDTTRLRSRSAAGRSEPAGRGTRNSSLLLLALGLRACLLFPLDNGGSGNNNSDSQRNSPPIEDSPHESMRSENGSRARRAILKIAKPAWNRRPVGRSNWGHRSRAGGPGLRYAKHIISHSGTRQQQPDAKQDHNRRARYVCSLCCLSWSGTVPCRLPTGRRSDAMRHVAGDRLILNGCRGPAARRHSPTAELDSRPTKSAGSLVRPAARRPAPFTPMFVAKAPSRQNGGPAELSL
jgi:hypothetical protein